jgi:prevent-host-death family protein
MSESIGVRELRQYASTYLARVKEGEAFTVTERGRPIARLVPLGDDAGDWRQDWIERGRMVGAARGGSFSWRDLPVFDLPGGIGSSAELLDEIRSDRV